MDIRHLISFATTLTSKRTDSSWYSGSTGIGTSEDSITTYKPQIPVIARDTLAALHYGDPIARRILEEIVDEAMREGCDFVDAEEQQREELNRRWRELDSKFNLRALAKQGLVRARRDGGCAVLCLPEVPRAQLEAALAKERKPGQPISKLVLVSAWDAKPIEWYSEPNNAKGAFGQPAVYQIDSPLHDLHTGNVVVADLNFRGPVHASHIIRIEGEPFDADELRKGSESIQGFGGDAYRLGPEGWGVSVLAPAFTRLRAYNAAAGSLDNVFSSIAQTVYKIKDLAEQLESKDTESLLHLRFTIMEKLRSVVNAVILDADGEEFAQVGTPLTDVPSLWAIKMLEMSQAAKMPVTRLFGREPAGLNATGDADIRVWYDQVSEFRSHRLTPTLLALAKAVDPGFAAEAVTYRSLWQISPQEHAAMYQSVAQADSIYHTMGAASAADVALTRFRPDGLQRNLEIDEVELERARVALEAPQSSELAGTPEPAAAGGQAAEDIQKLALNGAQVTALLEVVGQAANGLIPRESAKAVIVAAFPTLGAAEAENLLGPIGTAAFTPAEGGNGEQAGGA